MSYILTKSSIIICPHGGRLHLIPKYTTETVLIDGQLVYFHDDQYLINGCQSGCQKVEWSNWDTELLFQGKRYFLTNQSKASCIDPKYGFKGYALFLFFQTKTDTESLKKQMSKKG